MWAGLLIGILFGLFTTGHAWLAMVAAGIGLGVLWGAIFGFAAHLATRGERDFSSLRGLSAAHYDLVAREGGAERARTALEQAGLLPPDPRRPRPGIETSGIHAKPRRFGAQAACSAARTIAPETSD